MPGQRRQLAPVTGFGVTIADIMLHGRRDDPDPVIAAWIAEAETGHVQESRAGEHARPLEQHQPRPAGRARQAGREEAGHLLPAPLPRAGGPARIPTRPRPTSERRLFPRCCGRAGRCASCPREGFDFLRYRLALAIMLAVASTGAGSYRTAQELLGLHPVHASRFPTFIARLGEHGAFEPVTAAVCQLARELDEHGAPVDYARRRRLRRFSQAQLDVAGWRRQRYFSPILTPGRTAATSTALTCPPQPSRNTSRGSA